MTTYKEIQAEIAALQHQAEEARGTEISQALSQIKQIMNDYGITVDDLKTTRKKSINKPAGSVKYRDPESGKEWTGRGRMPNWLSGKDKDSFLA